MNALRDDSMIRNELVNLRKAEHGLDHRPQVTLEETSL